MLVRMRVSNGSRLGSTPASSRDHHKSVAGEHFQGVEDVFIGIDKNKSKAG
jgi:hypothetical protein